MYGRRCSCKSGWSIYVTPPLPPSSHLARDGRELESPPLLSPAIKPPSNGVLIDMGGDCDIVVGGVEPEVGGVCSEQLGQLSLNVCESVGLYERETALWLPSRGVAKSQCRSEGGS